ncbi:MAG: hypothetical protein AB7M12_09305 [Hyphomonadaceae bacterium]
MQQNDFLDGAWAQVAELLGWIAALFGAPGEIAARGGLVRRSRFDILAWLAPLEAAARRLLLIEAAALPPANNAPPLVARGRLRSALTDAPPPVLDADSARWRVRFRLGFPRARASSRLSPATGPNPALPNNAAPLARRLEALRRVAANRARVVHLLARRLRASLPACVARAYQRYRHRGGACAELLDEAQARVDALLPALNSS